jgi:hypothetical protein
MSISKAYPVIIHNNFNTKNIVLRKVAEYTFREHIKRDVLINNNDDESDDEIEESNKMGTKIIQKNIAFYDYPGCGNKQLYFVTPLYHRLCYFSCNGGNRELVIGFDNDVGNIDDVNNGEKCEIMSNTKQSIINIFDKIKTSVLLSYPDMSSENVSNVSFDSSTNRLTALFHKTKTQGGGSVTLCGIKKSDLLKKLFGELKTLSFNVVEKDGTEKELYKVGKFVLGFYVNIVYVPHIIDDKLTYKLNAKIGAEIREVEIKYNVTHVASELGKIVTIRQDTPIVRNIDI